MYRLLSLTQIGRILGHNVADNDFLPDHQSCGCCSCVLISLITFGCRILWPVTLLLQQSAIIHARFRRFLCMLSRCGLALSVAYKHRVPHFVCVCVPHCACRPETKQKVAEAGDIEADLMEFRELQRIVSTYLDRNTTSEARLW